MSEQKPTTQRVFDRLLWLIVGFLLLGNALDAISNAYTLIPPLVTYLGTIMLVVVWITGRKAKPEWKAMTGEKTRLQGIGPKYTFGMLGCLVLLWIPRIWSIQPEPGREDPSQREVVPSGNPRNTQAIFLEGIKHLRAYDLLKAERLFCQVARLDPKFLHARLYLARTWRDRGYDGAAEREAQRILDMAREMKVDRTEVRLYNAFHAETLGHWKEAVDEYSSVWDETGIHEFDSLALVQALNLAGQNRLALETIEEVRARHVSEKVPIQPMDEVRLEIERAIALMKSKRAEQLAAAQEAERVAKEAAAKAGESDNTYVLARAQLVQCDALSRLGLEYESACDRALAGFQQQGETVDVAKIYQILGNNATDIDDGLSYYRKALQIYKTLGFQRGIADVLVNISQLLFDAGRKYESAQVCGAALDTATQIASLNIPEIRLNCKYYAKILERAFEEAKQEADEVLALTRQQGNRALEAVALHDLAYVAHAQKLHQEALRSYRESMTIADELQDESWESRETIVLYAWLLSDLGRYSEARKELDRALEPYPMKDRKQRIADIVCWDRPILGPGTEQWLQMLERSAGFTLELCAEDEQEQIAPLENSDPALWERVEVKEPNC